MARLDSKPLHSNGTSLPSNSAKEMPKNTAETVPQESSSVVAADKDSTLHQSLLPTTDKEMEKKPQEEESNEVLDNSLETLATTLKQQLEHVNKEKQQLQTRQRKLKRDLQKAENQSRGEIEALKRAIARSESQDAKNRQRVQFLQDLVKRTLGCMDELDEQVAQAHANHAQVSAEATELEVALLRVREECREAEQRHQRQTAMLQRQNREQQTRLSGIESTRDEALAKIARLREQQLPMHTRDLADLKTRLNESQFVWRNYASNMKCAVDKCCTR
ncbi:hypothetical protein BDF19DRAFT_310109 [Syncephalis fuscata]|nr:hypothetical protein BDF19DRAFT_310109 [Syncephalis fuscata]